MKISTKLTGLIGAAALLSVSLYGLIAYRTYANIQFQRLLNHGLDYQQPLKALGEGIYRHQLAALDAKRKGVSDSEALNRADGLIRSALDQMATANRRVESDGYRLPDLTGLRQAVERILATRPRSDVSMSSIAQAHEAGFIQLRQSFQTAQVTFEILRDTDEDITLVGDLQFELLPSIIAARGALIARIFAFDDARSEGQMSAGVIRGLTENIQKQVGALQELARRHVRDATRIARADPEKRGWEQHVQPATGLQDRVQRFSSAITAVVADGQSASTLVDEDDAALTAFIGAWRALSTNVEEVLSSRLSANTRDFYIQSAAIAAIMVLLFFAMLWIVRSVTKDINTAESTTGRIAEGDLDLTVEGTERPDEIGGLARSVEVLRQNSEKQRALQENEREMMARMADTAKRVAESVQAIRAASGEISQGSSDLAARTERQASALQETVATMAEISATVSMNAQNSEQSRKLAADALSSAEDGGKAVASVVTAMSGIESSSSRIAEIIQVMEEISFQTKLLALNAAVEAARAGESGKGFAVVAQEVRSLADRSRQASQQIRDLIAVSSREVGQGVKLSGEAGEALTSIIDTVRRVAEIAPEIAAGSREQARSITEINKALNDLDAATQQNAALVEESSAAAASLADQSAQLVNVVAGFSAGRDEEMPAEPVVEEAPRPRRSAAKTAAPKDGDWDQEF